MISSQTANDNEDSRFDLVVIGSGFGSLFFLDRFVEKRPDARVLVLERGVQNTHAWQIENRRNSEIDAAATFSTPRSHKLWNFTIGLGGGTNCWYGQSPRFHPNDFRMKARYGVAQDWPLSYDDLEPYYVAAERKMSVAGGREMAAILPRSAPFPMPAHRMTAVDLVMRKAQPEFHFPMASARASVENDQRGRCCSTARCNLCPVDAKFTFENGFRNLAMNPNVEFRLECEVTHLDVANGVVSGAHYRQHGRDRRARGDLFALGANAIHSPAILLRSGIDHPLTGVGVHEQVGYDVEVMLGGLKNFDGGTITTALNYMLYDGPSRTQHGGALIHFENRWPYGLRNEYGRWRELAPLTVLVEDLPQQENRITTDSAGAVHVSHAKVSDYATRGVKHSFESLNRVLAPLPVEGIEFKRLRATESHIQGSLRMGNDRASSVVDSHQVHHDVRNLVVVGSSVFPSGSCANPSLSVAALSLRSAEYLA